MASDFKRADGLLICQFCGATFSNVFKVCPSCKKAPETKDEPFIIQKIMCDAYYVCPTGQMTSICCVSCDGFHICSNVCHIARVFREVKNLKSVLRWTEDGRVTIFGKELCEHAVVETSKTFVSKSGKDVMRER